MASQIGATRGRAYLFHQTRQPCSFGHNFKPVSLQVCSFSFYEKRSTHIFYEKKEATNEIVNADMPLNRLLRRDWFAIFALNPFIVKQAHFFSIGFYFYTFLKKNVGQIRFYFD